MRLTTILMKLEELNQNTINNNMKGTTDGVYKECDTIKDDMKVETEATVYKPFEEHVKQVEVEPLDEGSAVVENEMNKIG